MKHEKTRFTLTIFDRLNFEDVAAALRQAAEAVEDAGLKEGPITALPNTNADGIWTLKCVKSYD